jgi:hypothetical protein
VASSSALIHVLKYIKQTIVYDRHDKACQLLAEYARSCGGVASCTSRKDGARGEHVPDGHIHLRNESFIFDVTGINTHCPAYQTREFRTPGGALKDRENQKFATYSAHAAINQVTFVPIVIDLYGRVGGKATEFFEQIAIQSLEIDSYRPPHEHMNLTDFLVELSCIWQQFNSKIISQWACKSRALMYKHRRV